MAAFSPDGNRVLVGGLSDPTARLWCIDSKQELLSFRGHDVFVSLAAFLDEDSVVTIDANTVRVWRAPSWAEIDAAQKERSSVQ